MEREKLLVEISSGVMPPLVPQQFLCRIFKAVHVWLTLALEPPDA
jgi:hypothetical protein